MRMDWITYHEEPVTLHSGSSSHWLVRGDLLFQHEDLRMRVLSAWLQAIAGRIPEMMAHGRNGWMVTGVPTGGVSWAGALAEEMREYMPFTEGRERNPLRIVVDDVYTTGASLGEYAPYDIACVAVSRTKAIHPSTVAWATIPLP